MKYFLTVLVASVISTASLATTNFQQGAGNAVGANAEETFQALIDACSDVSILGLRARARLEMNRSTEDGQKQIVELMDQGMAACGGGDIDKATEIMNEAIAVGKASVTENFGTDASAETPVKAETAEEAPEESGSPMIAILIGLVVIVGIVVVMRRKKTVDDDE